MRVFFIFISLLWSADFRGGIETNVRKANKHRISCLLAFLKLSFCSVFRGG